MALNQEKYQTLVNWGMPHGAALSIADPALDAIDGGVVANPAALTSPATIQATYAQADIQKVRDDVAALQSKLTTLMTALRSAGVIS